MRENIDVEHQFKILEGEIEELEYKISDAQEEISLKKREIELREPEVQNAKKMRKFSGKLMGLNFSHNDGPSIRNSRNDTRDTFTDER
jgi:TolA-binding protein